MNKKISVTFLILIVIGVGFFIYKNQASNGPERQIQNLLAQKYNKPANTVIIETNLNTGAFAKGSVNFKDEMGGGIWFAAKTTNGWELAFDGNGIAPCDAINKYDFPRDIVPQCIDTQDENKLIER